MTLSLQDWKFEFADELQRLRPHLTRKVAMAIATSESPSARSVAPKTAARRYHQLHPPAAKR